MNARHIPFICSPAGLMLLPATAGAAETASISAAGSAIQVIFGLIMVLGVIMTIAWLFKRFAPGMAQNGSIARIVGGVNVGNRERVLVVEVAGRWLVVGVAPGQVTGIANLEAGDAITEHLNRPVPAAHPFAKWLTQSMNKSRPTNPTEGK